MDARLLGAWDSVHQYYLLHGTQEQEPASSALALVRADDEQPEAVELKKHRGGRHVTCAIDGASSKEQQQQGCAL